MTPHWGVIASPRLAAASAPDYTARVPVPLRYALLQLPGLLLAGGVLWLLCDWGWLSRSAALALLALWIAKDAAMYPLLRHAYDSTPSRLVGAERLIGQQGVAHEAIDPIGYVRVSGELWRAESSSPGVVIGARSRVRVHAVRGLTLLVSPDEETSSGSGC